MSRGLAYSRGPKAIALAPALAMVCVMLCFTKGAATPCDPETVGVDTSRSQGVIAVVRGSAAGQTFTTIDTLIRSITVWRWRDEDTTAAPMKLWITGTYEDGLPDLNNIILSGPALVAFGDGVHPVKIQYVFDPPLALPGPGKYAFYIQIQPDCSFPYIVGLLAATTDDYPGGGAVGAYGNKCDFGGRASYVDPPVGSRIRRRVLSNPLDARAPPDLGRAEGALPVIEAPLQVSREPHPTQLGAFTSSRHTLSA